MTPFPWQSGLRSSTGVRLPENSQWQKGFERYIRFRAYLISPKMTPSKSVRSKTLSHFIGWVSGFFNFHFSRYHFLEKPRWQLQFLRKNFALFWRRVVNQHCCWLTLLLEIVLVLTTPIIWILATTKYNPRIVIKGLPLL